MYDRGLQKQKEVATMTLEGLYLFTYKLKVLP